MKRHSIKYRSLIINWLVLIGIICVITLMLIRESPKRLDRYEASWYNSFKEQSWSGIMYFDMVKRIGQPIHTRQYEDGGIGCDFLVYGRFGFIGRVISKKRGDPGACAVFKDGRCTAWGLPFRNQFLPDGGWVD